MSRSQIKHQQIAQFTSKMKPRESKQPPSADLLVCFPSRAHLTLLPKSICSPARPSEHNQRHNNPHRHNPHHHHRLKKSSTRGRGAGQASPLLWAKNKQMGSEISEPTSPKVTCAGQIKVRHKASACKNWQSVMEEIERIHNHRKNKKRSSWMDSFGFKKDIMQFLTCLRNIKFDFRCFGSFPQSEITTDEEEEVEVDEECQTSNNHGVGEGISDGNEASRTIFSKWFMVLQENQNSDLCNENNKDKCLSEESIATSSVPPPNALLLMRCRSAPAKSWLEEKEEEEGEVDEVEEEEEEEEEQEQQAKKGKNLKALIEEEKYNSRKTENLVVMRYDTDFYKLSSDIAKETWVVGGIRDPLSRSRSWKR